MDSFWVLGAIVVGFALSADQPTPAGPGPKAGKKPLLPITVREEQGGIAGTSVREWTVDKTGKWKLARYTVRGGKEVADSRSEKTGMLTPKQLADLTERLTKHDPAGLSKQLGTAEKVNPHSYFLEFGDSKVTIAGVPPRTSGTAKANILEAAPSADRKAKDEWRRAGETVQAVIDATTPD